MFLLVRIVLTGSPATGKTAVALGLASFLGCPCISANELAFKIGAAKKLKSGGKAEKEFTVDLKKLQHALAAIFLKQKNVVAEGHLLCEFALPANVVVVLRADPRILLKRYAKRGYPRKKAVANVLVEVLDYCLIEAEEHYGANKVMQLDLSKKVSPAKILGKIRRRKGDAVDWSEMLTKSPLSRLAAAS